MGQQPNSLDDFVLWNKNKIGRIALIGTLVRGPNIFVVLIWSTVEDPSEAVHLITLVKAELFQLVHFHSVVSHVLYDFTVRVVVQAWGRHHVGVSVDFKHSCCMFVTFVLDVKIIPKKYALVFVFDSFFFYKYFNRVFLLIFDLLLGSHLFLCLDVLFMRLHIGV